MSNKLLRIGLPLAVIVGVTIITIARNPPDYPEEQTPSSIALPEAAPSEDPQRNLSAKAAPNYDAEMLVLLPKSVPGHELGWLSGDWSFDVESGACGLTFPAKTLHFRASNEGLIVLAAPEPNNTKATSNVRGFASVNPGERDFTNVTPPNWNDAYYRLKAEGEHMLSGELVEFRRETTDWQVTKTFKMKKCGR